MGAPATAVAKKPAATGIARQQTHIPEALCGRVVARIHLAGLERTHRRVVSRELLVAEGAPLSCAALRETIQRLRNLGIFRRVDVRVTPKRSAASDPPGVRLTLSFDEKWTLLPVFSAGRGGGRLYLLAGAQDSHVAGRYIQVQGYWYTLAGTHSGVLSVADPRLGHTRLRGAIVLEHGNRNRFRYETSGAPVAAWSRLRDRLTLSLSDLRAPQRTWGVELHGLWDRFSTRLLNSTLQAPPGRGGGSNQLLAPDRALPVDGAWLLPRVWVKRGRIDRDDYLESRGYVRLSLTGGVPLSGALRGSSWGRVLLTGKWAWLPAARAHRGAGRDALAGRKTRRFVPWRRLNLVARASLGAQLGGHPEHRFVVGGLGSVRGYWEGRFVGERLASLNVEARMPSWHSRLLVLQHVVFADMGWVRATEGGAVAGGLPPQPGWQGGASVGAGVRVILPLIAQFVARLDVAWAIHDNDWRVSFGSQQFF